MTYIWNSCNEWCNLVSTPLMFPDACSKCFLDLKHAQLRLHNVHNDSVSCWLKNTEGMTYQWTLLHQTVTGDNFCIIESSCNALCWLQFRTLLNPRKFLSGKFSAGQITDVYVVSFSAAYQSTCHLRGKCKLFIVAAKH